jgi:hypothetical protein
VCMVSVGVRCLWVTAPKKIRHLIACPDNPTATIGAGLSHAKPSASAIFK